MHPSCHSLVCPASPQCCFFSDVVGFATISCNLEPRKVADVLDRLCSKLDELSHDHNVFKVETIGDAHSTHFTLFHQMIVCLAMQA